MTLNTIAIGDDSFYWGFPYFSEKVSEKVTLGDFCEKVKHFKRYIDCQNLVISWVGIEHKKLVSHLL